MTEPGDEGQAGAIDVGQDLELFGIELFEEGRATFELTDLLARHDGRLYGGAAIGVAVALAEAVTGRRALWSTVQFISAASKLGDRFDCTVEVLASGRRTSQVRVRAFVGDVEVFCALGANALEKTGALNGWFEAPPAVVGPDEAPPFQFAMPPEMLAAREPVRSIRLMEMRMALSADPDQPTSSHLWARIPGRPVTPAVLAYLADMVPMSIAQAAGRMGGGTSLDNTIRLGAPAESEWVLLDMHPHLAHGGFGTGTGLLWSPAGDLLAVGSQTSSLHVFD
jgi:acyl-CoA thioesterase